MGQVKDATEEPIDRRIKLIPTNSDPGKAERLRKDWLYGVGLNSITGALGAIWNHFRKIDKRIDDLEDRLKELDGISMERHILKPANVTEYHIEQWIVDNTVENPDESG